MNQGLRALPSQTRRATLLLRHPRRAAVGPQTARWWAAAAAACAPSIHAQSPRATQTRHARAHCGKRYTGPHGSSGCYGRGGGGGDGRSRSWHAAGCSRRARAGGLGTQQQHTGVGAGVSRRLLRCCCCVNCSCRGGARYPHARALAYACRHIAVFFCAARPQTRASTYWQTVLASPVSSEATLRLRAYRSLAATAAAIFSLPLAFVIFFPFCRLRPPFLSLCRVFSVCSSLASLASSPPFFFFAGPLALPVCSGYSMRYFKG